MLNKKIFVIGGNGFVGSAFVAHLKNEGSYVYSVTKDNYTDFINKECDILINANGNSKKYSSKSDPINDFDASVRSVALSIVNFKAENYVYLSSSEVYPDNSKLELTSETQIIDPSKLSTYGLHKYLAENLVRGRNRNWLIIRMGGFVGPGIKKNAIYDMINNKPIWLSPDSEIQYINTLTNAFLVSKIIDFGVTNEIINVSASGTINLGEAYKIIGSQSVFQINAPIVKNEIKLNKLKSILGDVIPSTSDEVTNFVSKLKSAN